MFHGKRVIVVMPAYNAAQTIEKTFREIPLDLVDEVVVVEVARSMSLGESLVLSSELAAARPIRNTDVASLPTAPAR